MMMMLGKRDAVMQQVATVQFSVVSQDDVKTTIFWQT